MKKCRPKLQRELTSLCNYDKWKTDTPDNHLKRVTSCEQCNEDLYEGDFVLKVEDGFLHADCFDEYAEERLVERVIPEFKKEDL